MKTFCSVLFCSVIDEKICLFFQPIEKQNAMTDSARLGDCSAFQSSNKKRFLAAS